MKSFPLSSISSKGVYFGLTMPTTLTLAELGTAWLLDGPA
jgi:hypothetical protein